MEMWIRNGWVIPWKSRITEYDWIVTLFTELSTTSHFRPLNVPRQKSSGQLYLLLLNISHISWLRS